ncbi:MAG: amidohydrolase family protein, partial [Candidatus Rokubacteria bacterium]|nr:amidohydrolase family protein [Candidatus Rokubacteria bacterium]
ATQWAARCLGLERELGTLEKGRLADLVVVDCNPLDDVKILLDPARIALVLKGGAVCINRGGAPAR